MHRDFENPSRKPTPEEYSKQREAEKQDRMASHDTAGQGMIQGAQAVNQIMDKRLVVSMLHTRAGELRRQAEGIERLAQLVGAASDHDYHLFSYLLTMTDRR